MTAKSHRLPATNEIKLRACALVAAAGFGVCLSGAPAANAATVVVSTHASPGFIATNTLDLSGFTSTSSNVLSNNGLTLSAVSTDPTQGLSSTAAGSTKSVTPSNLLGYFDFTTSGSTAFDGLAFQLGNFSGSPLTTLFYTVLSGTDVVSSGSFTGVPSGGFEGVVFQATSGTFTDVQLAVKNSCCADAFTAGGSNFASVMNVSAHTVNVVRAAVPEPATWAMMLVGFGLAGAVLRRRGASQALRA